MKKYFSLFFVALFATMSFSLNSCGDDKDDPDNPGGGNNGSYGETFKVNGTPFYYARDYKIEGMEFLGTKRTSLATYDVANDYVLLQFLDVQNTPLKIDDMGMMQPDKQDYTVRMDGILNLEKFNPEKAKKGEVLDFRQAVRSEHKDSNDPKYLLDAFNYMHIYDEAANTSNGKIFTWRSKPQGNVRFVSYNAENEYLTLEFDNLTLEVYQGSDYSGYPYKANSLTITGNIVFTPDMYN
ncbi:MAG: hypothetical protein K2N05_04655 [Muribaculaceae bacterium]|nr:hypothetical protein [Muribaculaceae bacterium]